MISEASYFDSAKILNVEIPAIKAVALVEGNGAGFLNSGEPVILFEPHIFWKELTKRNLNPMDYLTSFVDKKIIPNQEYRDILYPKWKPGAYGPVSTQHARLERAIKINREAALSSASWGAFQILGNNHKDCGCKDIQEFVNAMYKSVDEHLRLFCNFLKTTGLDKHLRSKNWAAFAKGYNGASYKENNYDTRLEKAYATYTNIHIRNANNKSI